MKKKHQNLFFFVGFAILFLMVSQLDFAEVWQGVSHAGYWFLAVVGIWFFLYIMNTASWWIIIRANGARDALSFHWLYKITVSGFALNYATPGGLLGGEPYKMMMLSPKIGAERATSSVLLHTMTHIFSHFWFWLLSCILYVCIEPMSVFMAVLLLLVAAFCIAAIWFFLKGYKRGIAFSALTIVSHVPFVKRWAKGYIEKHQAQLHTIDRQIAALHGQNRSTFVTAVLLELLCRVLSAFEIYFVLLVIMPHPSYLECILILAFTSLFANMLFFIPLQLGGREGGFLMSASGLGLSASAGILVALLVRLRELIWTAIGLLLIKWEKRA